jgi:hypothetical protein
VDGRVFDAWVAGLGARSRRRPVLLAAVGLVLAWPRIARGQGLARPGEPCTSSEQCEQWSGCGVPAPVICADNGYAWDGPLNCCVGQDQFCGSHAECCGGLVCLGSHSIDGCGAGRCLPRETFAVVATVTACTESAQCSQEDGYAVCSDEGLCCMFAGSRCFVGAQCCGGLACVKDDPTDPRWYAPGTCALAD